MHSTSLTTTMPIADASATSAERRGVALMVAGGLMLGTLGVFLEEAGQSAPTAVFFRCAFGALALFAWGVATGRWRELRLDARRLALALVAGVLVVMNWLLFFAAIRLTSIGVATVAFHVQPLWVIGLSAWWLRERVTPLQCAAAVVALLGLALASGLAGGVTIGREQAIGIAMCLGGSLSYAVVTLIATHARGIGSYALSFWQCAVGAVLLAWWPFVNGWPTSGAAWGYLAGLGVIHTGLAYVVLYAGMARLPAARVAVLQFVYPVAAVLIDRVVYGHALSTAQWVGVGLMGAALWVVRRGQQQAPSPTLQEG